MCKIKPLSVHENILIFGKNRIKYNMQKRKVSITENFGGLVKHKSNLFKFEYNLDRNINIGYPISIYSCMINNLTKDKAGLHPTQKPQKLFDYLIRTYTDKNDIVLDTFSGSGTTAAACLESDRQFICMENNKKYYDISLQRIDPLIRQGKLF